jgi:hypothetical protein
VFELAKWLGSRKATISGTVRGDVGVITVRFRDKMIPRQVSIVAVNGLSDRGTLMDTLNANGQRHKPKRRAIIS